MIFLFSGETSSQLDEFRQLISLSNEYSTNLMCGVINYLKRNGVKNSPAELVTSKFNYSIVSVLKF